MKCLNLYCSDHFNLAYSLEAGGSAFRDPKDEYNPLNRPYQHSYIQFIVTGRSITKIKGKTVNKM